MAHKRLLSYSALLALCYLVGVTWADTAGGVQNSSSPVVALPQTPDKSTQVTLPAAPRVVSTLTNKAINNNISTGTTAAPDCICDGALLPRLGEDGKELKICPECKCEHVARNTTLIKVVVIIVIWIISILVIYMLFLMCLDPLLNKRVKANYQEHTNEDDDPTATTPPLPNVGNQELNSRANVLNRVGHQQDKWKRQVREQRRHIYDRHTMLN